MKSGDHEFGGQFILLNSLNGRAACTLSHSTILKNPKISLCKYIARRCIFEYMLLFERKIDVK